MLIAKIDSLVEIKNAKVITVALDTAEDRTNIETRPRWIVQDLYKGITPKSFTTECNSVFKATTLIARCMVWVIRANDRRAKMN